MLLPGAICVVLLEFVDYMMLFLPHVSICFVDFCDIDNKLKKVNIDFLKAFLHACVDRKIHKN